MSNFAARFVKLLKNWIMEQAIYDIKDWGEKYGYDVCLNRLLCIMKEQCTPREVIDIADELWEYDH